MDRQLLAPPTPPLGSAVGIDVVDVGRIADLLARHPGAAGRLFSPGERRDAGGDVTRLAARWAAKEAVAKIVGGLAALDLGDVEVRSTPAGPRLVVAGRAAAAAAVRGWGVWSVSLAHDGAVAAAAVVASAA